MIFDDCFEFFWDVTLTLELWKPRVKTPRNSAGCCDPCQTHRKCPWNKPSLDNNKDASWQTTWLFSDKAGWVHSSQTRANDKTPFIGNTFSSPGSAQPLLSMTFFCFFPTLPSHIQIFITRHGSFLQGRQFFAELFELGLAGLAGPSCLKSSWLSYTSHIRFKVYVLYNWYMIWYNQWYIHPIWPIMTCNGVGMPMVKWCWEYHFCIFYDYSSAAWLLRPSSLRKMCPEIRPSKFLISGFVLLIGPLKKKQGS